MLRVLSLGGGVQSTTLPLMVLHGEVDSKLDAAVFADTGWESKATYAHLDWLEGELMAGGIPVHRVSAGNIRDDHIASLTGDGTHYARMPMFVAVHTPAHYEPVYEYDDDGEPFLTGETRWVEEEIKVGMIRRQCTQEYKTEPIRVKLRELLGIKPRSHGPREIVCEQWFGISLDEYQRMRTADTRWLTHRYPLVDARMTRQDCVLWLDGHGYPIPPKSACIGCPYHRDAVWREMRLNRPDEWADAVGFDHAMRVIPGVRGEVFLHRSLKPLEQVDLRNDRDRGQLDLFGEECEGLCGV